MSQATDWEAAQSAPAKTDISDDVSVDMSVATKVDAQDTDSTAISLLAGADDSDTAGDNISAAAAMGSNPIATPSGTEETRKAEVEIHQEADEPSLIKPG